MTALFAVAVVALRDRALITDAPAVSPHTLDHLPGRAIRGMLASVCTPTELDLLIAEESVLCGPGLPAVPTPEPDFSLRGHQLAYPAARTIVSVDQGRGSYDLDDARTVQTHDPATKIGPVAGLIVEDVEARQVALPTSTHQRLQRRKGNAPGGPFTETVLEPGTVFEIRFRLADHVSDPEKVLDTLESVLTRPGLQIGSSAHAAYGGDLTLVSFTYAENEPWSDAPTDTAADEPVHLALVTPALVRNTHTGEHDPAALPAAVTANLSRIFGNALGRPVSVTIATGLPPSIGSTRIGGFDRGYRGLRPESWAAAAGSVVTVVVDAPVSADLWDRALSDRIGERIADGFGLLRRTPETLWWNEVGAELHRQPSIDGTPAAVRLRDGTASPTVDHDDADVQVLRTALFRNAAPRAVADLAIWLARHATSIPSNSTLARVNTLLSAPSQNPDAASADLAAVQHWVASYESEGTPDDRPVAVALSHCRIRWDDNTSWTLFDLVSELSEQSYDTSSSILHQTADPRTDRHAGLALAAALSEHSLITSSTADRLRDTEAWIKEHNIELRHAVLVNLLHALRNGKAQS